MTPEETAQRLETMGIEACVNLERFISGQNPERSMHRTVARLVFISDAHVQLLSEPQNRDPDVIGDIWASSALAFIDRGTRLHRVLRSLAKIPLLIKPDLKPTRIREWQETREEVFARNPQYHGRRYGPQYAQAVATQRLR